MGKSYEIAIAGAGPAGLAAALYLKRAGHKVTIFERFDAPKPVGSGLILQPTGLTVLADLGLLDEILSLGSRIERLHGTDARSGRTVLEVRYDARRGRRFGLAIHRAALFGVLFRAALREAVAIETNVEVETPETAERATLVCGNGRRLGPFDLIVDASGARSKLRSYLGDNAMPRPLAYGAFWASLGWRDGFDRSALLQRYDKASIMVGVLPLGRPEPGAQDMAAFFWSLKPADAEQVKAKGLEAWKASVVSVWPECEAFTGQIDSFEQLSLARYGQHTMRLPAGRRLAIIGDAAHSTSPQLGQRREYGAARRRRAQPCVGAGGRHRRSAGGLCKRAPLACARLPGAVVVADAVLPIGLRSLALCPRPHDGGTGENPAGTAIPCRHGRWYGNRSVQADRACGVARACSRMISDR